MKKKAKKIIKKIKKRVSVDLVCACSGVRPEDEKEEVDLT